MPPSHLVPARALAVGLAAVLAAGACSTSPTAQSPAGTSSAGGAATTSGTGTGSGTTSTTGPTPTTSTTSSPTPDPSAPAVALLGGLDVPWSIAMLPDGSSLVSVRNTGEVRHVPKPGSGGRATVAGTLPITRVAGEGGLLGLAVPEDFDANPVFYAYYSTDNDNRIAAVPWRDGTLGEPQVIFDGIPMGRNHNGGRIAFGPDGYLYVGTGEAGDRSLSQNLGSLGGKILRLTPEGKPAPGNPFGGSAIWSYGHRNVQGLAWDSQDRLWASEFGANTFDELNLIEPGENYGWPEVEGRADDPDFVDPVAQWPTSDMSPSGIAVGADGAVYMAALRGESLWRVPINADGSAGTPSRHLEGTYGRVRDIRFVDGRAWILTNNGDDDRLMSLPLSDVGAA
jgi:glucose/arabinose dehydrogenase